MRPHPRILTSAKWFFTPVAALLIAITTLSYRYSSLLCYNDTSSGESARLNIDHAILRWSRYWGATQAIHYFRWEFSPLKDPAPTWTWKFYDPGPIGKHLFLPLWFPTGAALLVTTVLWSRDTIKRRRRRAGLCLKCGYDLRGLDVTASCPECGAARNSTS